MRLFLANQELLIYNIYSPPDKQLQLHDIKPTNSDWIIVGDFNSHSPSWGYADLDAKGEELEHWMITNQLVLINHPDDPPTFYSRVWRTTSTPDLGLATDDIHKIANRTVCPQLGGSDHRPVIISLKKDTSEPKKNRPPTWNYKKAKWDLFTGSMERKALTIQIGTNANENIKSFNKIILEAAKYAIPRGHRKDYKPYWSEHLDTLHKNLDRAREDMEENPTDDTVTEHNKAKAIFTRAKITETRNSWHEKTSSLNMEKDIQGLWKLTKALNEDTQSKSKLVIEDNAQLYSDKKAANILA